jgi:hypothetical protein
MAETIIWCNMIHLLFYIFVIFYYFGVWFTDNFNPIGQEFANLVILGLLAIITTKRENK